MNTVLVTGGAGFIGTNLVRRLVSCGWEVRILDDFSSGLRSNLEELDVNVFDGSIMDALAVNRAMKGVQQVVHLAARGSVPRSIREPVLTNKINAEGTLNILETARKAGASVIFSSSSSVYGRNSALPKNEKMWVAPMSPYAASKLSAESMCEAYAAAYGVPVAIFRFFNVYGPWQRPDHEYAAVIPRWIWSALRGEEILINGDGSQTRDFTFVDTVVDVLVQVLSTQFTYSGPVNLAFGSRVSLLDIVTRIQECVGQPVRVKHGPPRPTDVAHSQNDPTLLRELFAQVDPVTLEEGLRRTFYWLREQAADGVHP